MKVMLMKIGMLSLAAAAVLTLAGCAQPGPYNQQGMGGMSGMSGMGGMSGMSGMGGMNGMSGMGGMSGMSGMGGMSGMSGMSGMGGMDNCIQWTRNSQGVIQCSKLATPKK